MDVISRKQEQPGYRTVVGLFAFLVRTINNLPTLQGFVDDLSSEVQPVRCAPVRGRLCGFELHKNRMQRHSLRTVASIEESPKSRILPGFGFWSLPEFLLEIVLDVPTAFSSLIFRQLTNGKCERTNKESKGGKEYASLASAFCQ